MECGRATHSEGGSENQCRFGGDRQGAEKSTLAETAVIHRLDKEEAQLRQKIQDDWESEGLEFDRDHPHDVWSLYAPKPGDPPHFTVEHREGYSTIESALEEIKEESDWKVRRNLLLQLQTVIAGKMPYADKTAKIEEISVAHFKAILPKKLLNESHKYGYGWDEDTIRRLCETKEERTLRDRQKAETEKSRSEEIQHEVEALQERENKLLAEKYGLDYVPGEVSHTRSFRIGPIEIPEIPIRALLQESPK